MNAIKMKNDVDKKRNEVIKLSVILILRLECLVITKNMSTAVKINKNGIKTKYLNTKYHIRCVSVGEDPCLKSLNKKSMDR